MTIQKFEEAREILLMINKLERHYDEHFSSRSCLKGEICFINSNSTITDTIIEDFMPMSEEEFFNKYQLKLDNEINNLKNKFAMLQL